MVSIASSVYHLWLDRSILAKSGFQPLGVSSMFDAYCTQCGKHTLIFPSQILGIDNTDRGIEVAFVCWCGSEQTWVTGTHDHEVAAA